MAEETMIITARLTLLDQCL